MFHSWPGWYVILWGATWGNNDAALQWFIVVGALSVLFRKYIKRLLKKINDKFRKPLHDHIKEELEAHRILIDQRLADHHEHIMNEVRKIGNEETG